MENDLKQFVYDNLPKKIEESGLKKYRIAERLGIGNFHLSFMANPETWEKCPDYAWQRVYDWLKTGGSVDDFAAVSLPERKYTPKERSVQPEQSPNNKGNDIMKSLTEGILIAAEETNKKEPGSDNLKSLIFPTGGKPKDLLDAAVEKESRKKHKLKVCHPKSSKISFYKLEKLFEKMQGIIRELNIAINQISSIHYGTKKFQLCPKCDGAKVLMCYPEQVENEHPVAIQCDICKGKGVIPRPE